MQAAYLENTLARKSQMRSHTSTRYDNLNMHCRFHTGTGHSHLPLNLVTEDYISDGNKMTRFRVSAEILSESLMLGLFLRSKEYSNEILFNQRLYFLVCVVDSVD